MTAAKVNVWTKARRLFGPTVLVASACLVGCDSEQTASVDATAGSELVDSSIDERKGFDAGGDSGLPPMPEMPNANTAASLTVGDAAPQLQLAKFVKGEATDLSNKDRVHVVEFWATWCGPCKAGMPHISKLQKQHGDAVAFVGVTQEDEATVQGFLSETAMNGETWDDVIQYRLALDDNAMTNQTYMDAAGQTGIPCAFIVGKEGVIEWIGHPARIDEPLQQVVDGTWNREQAAKDILAQGRLSELSMSLPIWMGSGQFDKALDALGEIEKEMGPNPSVTMMRLQIKERSGVTEGLTELRDEVVELGWNDAMLLNNLAWNTAESGKDLEIALRAAKRCVELSEEAEAAFLDTLARVYYEMGQLDEAIAWQQKAVDADSGRMPEIKDTLKKYQSKAKAGEEPGDSEESK